MLKEINIRFFETWKPERGTNLEARAWQAFGITTTP